MTPFSLFVFVFALACERTSSKRLAWKVDVLKDRKTDGLQARPCIFQPGNFTGWGSDGVKKKKKKKKWSSVVCATASVHAGIRFPLSKKQRLCCCHYRQQSRFFSFFFFFRSAFRLLKRRKPRLGRPDSPICASRMPNFSVLSPFRRFNVIRGAVCSTCMWARWISI